jgi:hypothetical protein
MSSNADPVYPDCPIIARTVDVRGLAKPELIRELARNEVSMNPYGELLFADERFTTSGESYRQKTVELRVRDLGFAKGETSEEIFKRASAFGLEVCPLELAPYLRLQFLEQPEGDRITISSHKISEDEAFPNGFYLIRRDDGLWLRGYRASSDNVWSPDEHFIFCRSLDSHA